MTFLKEREEVMGRGRENEYLVLICIIRKLNVIFGPKDKHMQSAESAKSSLQEGQVKSWLVWVWNFPGHEAEILRGQDFPGDPMLMEKADGFQSKN